MTSMGPAAEWRTALRQGRFLLQRSEESGTFHFPPRVAQAGHGALSFEEASGLGTVYAATLVRPKPPAPSYNVVIVELDEGPRLMSRIVGPEGASIAIGLRVQAFIDPSGEEPIVLFRPAEDLAAH